MVCVCDIGTIYAETQTSFLKAAQEFRWLLYYLLTISKSNHKSSGILSNRVTNAYALSVLVLLCTY